MERPVEARVARLESDVAHLRSDVTEIKGDLRALRERMDTRMDRLESKFDRKLDSLQNWGILLYITLATGTFGTMARAFGWL